MQTLTWDTVNVSTVAPPPQRCNRSPSRRQIRDTVNWIFSEQMLACYVSIFRETFWPDGKLAPHVRVRTEGERSETKERAQQKLLDNIPGRRALRSHCVHTGTVHHQTVGGVNALKRCNITMNIFTSVDSVWPSRCSISHHVRE